MDLIPIKDYEGLYSFDKNTNQVYSHKPKKYLKPQLVKGYYNIKLHKNKKQTLTKSHRLIYQIYYPDIDITNLQIDHIDNNKTNNNIENLRHCNNSENKCNTKVQKNNISTGLKNINKTRTGSYQVKIVKNKIRYTKTFKTLEEAIEYKHIKLIELHGDFAYTV